MSVEDTYVDVTIRSKTARGNVSEKTTRLQLPITWIVNKKPSIVNKENAFLTLFGPSGIVLYLIGYKIFGAGVFIVYGWFGIYMLRSKWNLYKIGSGTISIDKKGFNDSRLGTYQVPWSSIRKHACTMSSKDGKLYAVVVVSDDAKALECVSVLYRRSNLFPPKSKKAVFKLPLKDVEKSSEIAQAIQIFIRASEFD